MIWRLNLNRLQTVLQFFHRLKRAYQCAIFLILLIATILFARVLTRTHNKITNQIFSDSIALQQQQNWLSKQSEIREIFDNIISQIQTSEQEASGSLSATIESIISGINCRYELSDESRSTCDGVVLSGVWLNLYDTDIGTLVEIYSELDGKNGVLSEVHIRATKSDKINIRCLIESIQLVQR